MSVEDTLQVVEGLSVGFFQAKEELNLELSPEKSGAFVGWLADYWNQTGDLPSEAAIKMMLQLEYGSRSTDA